MSFQRQLLLLAELERDRIDTMTSIGGCLVSFAVEDVSQMSSTVLASDFGAFHPEGAIFMCFQCAWDAIVESRPSTARIELGFGLVQVCTTSSTLVHSLLEMFVVLSCENIINDKIFDYSTHFFVPVPGLSVPFSLSTLYCSGVSLVFHSSSVSFSAIADLL